MRKKIILVIAVLLAGIITGTAAFGYVYLTEDNAGEGNDEIAGLIAETSGGESEKLDKRISFLLIGADMRPGEDSFNADTIIVASIDPETKIVSLLSIPRDTRVELYGSKFLKINAVPMIRGIPELISVVTDLTGIQLDGYVLTNFEGFKKIVDTLGGINIYVEKDMYYETGDEINGVIDLKEGQQLLTGYEALQYARFRHDSMADIGRTARQQKVLKAAAREALQMGTITKLPKLVPQLMDSIKTNLSLADMLKLSRVAASFDSSKMVTQTLPGTFLDFDGLSYWEVNRNQVKKVAQNLLMGITTDRIVNHRVVDLLDPEIRSHITVPGSPTDPNSKKSSGYQDFLDEEDNGESNGENNQEDMEESEPDDSVKQDQDGDQNSEEGTNQGEKEQNSEEEQNEEINAEDSQTSQEESGQTPDSTTTGEVSGKQSISAENGILFAVR